MVLRVSHKATVHNTFVKRVPSLAQVFGSVTTVILVFRAKELAVNPKLKQQTVDHQPVTLLVVAPVVLFHVILVRRVQQAKTPSSVVVKVVQAVTKPWATTSRHFRIILELLDQSPKINGVQLFSSTLGQQKMEASRKAPRKLSLSETMVKSVLKVRVVIQIASIGTVQKKNHQETILQSVPQGHKLLEILSTTSRSRTPHLKM